MEYVSSFVTETLVVTLCEGADFADVAAKCSVEPGTDGVGYVNDDGPLDFVMVPLAFDGQDVTVRFSYDPMLYDSPTEWLDGGVFTGIVAGVR